MDWAGPVEAEGEVVGITIGIGVADHISRGIFSLEFDSPHVSWHLEWEETAWFVFAIDYF